ncbi:MAG TPA: ABC transporter substrate-binding protein [Pseudonocardiaceae bacterium]|jgi:4,5-dihydroxyphthalate decarboxylase|nr:ABC transporter substrate-binding protein [Pseudonocardiaceae bacterium]
MTAPLRLTLATSYYDQVADILSGRQSVEGVELHCLQLTVEEIFQRFLRFREWDVSELSMAGYVAMIAAGDTSLVGLPIFPSRVFRHSSVYVRTGDITTPEQLRGKRIGVPEWAQTATVYLRALLVDEWQIPLTEVDWVQAGVNDPGREEKAEIHLPAGVSLTPAPERSLDEMLLAGDLDAVFSAHPPTSYLTGDPRVTRLFERDYPTVEEEYGRRTGIVPIMHLMVVRREVFDAEPWLGPNLLTAFERARDASVRRLGRAPGGPGSPVPLLWTAAELARTASVFGGQVWPYGVAANRRTLDAFCDWCHQQGVTARRVTLDELFPPSVGFTPRT